MQSVLTLELCNVMVISRTAWEVIERDHPVKACKVFASLQRGCEEKVGGCRGVGASSSSLRYLSASV